MADFFDIESWFWRLILVAFPIFIVLGIYLYNLFRNWWFKGGFWKSFRISAEETFQVYTNKQKEETKIETISENQPSVRDFQKWMEEIDEDLNKKVVIVFDNFDRLPKKHILNIWSSIHIFFAEKEYKNIKVILPFDREHIRNAFKDLNSDNTDNNGEVKFADDYVNKTFDIVFRVSLPIMSDWKRFFENQWKEVFTVFDENELKLVIQVYEFLNRRITPREIIAFINEILTIKYLDNEYKERYIAIFILAKDHILKDPLKSIIDLDYLDGLKTLYQNDVGFAKQVTAIVYHIEVESALELIYTQELKDSLNKNNVEQFNNICKSEFIEAIFLTVIHDLDVYENPIKTLARIEDNTNLSLHSISQSWIIFYNKEFDNSRSIEELKIEDWQIILINKSDDVRYAKKIIRAYGKLINDTNTLMYISLIDLMKKELGSDKVLPFLSSITIKPDEFIKLIEQTGKDFKQYKLSCNESEMDTFISKKSIEDLLKIKSTNVLTENYRLPNYIKSLKKQLSEYAGQNNIQFSNDVLFKLKETVKENGALKAIFNESQIYSLFVNHPSSTLPIINELISMRIASGSTFNASYSSSFQSVMGKNDDLLIKDITENILDYISYENFLLLAPYFKGSILFKQVALKLISDGKIKKDADVAKLINKYAEIKNALDIEGDYLLVEFDRLRLDSNKLEINNFSDDFVNDCYSNSDLGISKEFIDTFNNSFKRFNEDSYKVVFESSSDIYFRFFDRIEDESLTQDSLNVFKDQFLNYLIDGNLTGDWWAILARYDSSSNIDISIHNFLKDLRDQIINSRIILNLESGLELIPYFLKHKLLNDRSDVFRTIIKQEFVDNEEFVKLLVSNSSEIKTLYKEATSEDKSEFRNIVNSNRSDKVLVEELAKLLDIRKTKEKEVD